MREAVVAVLVVAVGAACGQAAEPDPPKTTFIEPKTRLWQAILTPDGKGVVTVTGDERTLRVWDTTTRKDRTWKQGATDAGSILFPAGGKTVLVGRRDGTVSSHDLATGKELARAKVGEKGMDESPFFPLAAGTYGACTFDLDPEGKLLVMDNPNAMTLTAVRWPRGEVAARLKNKPRDGEGYATQVRFGPDGKSLYCLCAGEARGFVAVWDMTTESLSRTLVPPRTVSRMTVSNDGRWIGVGGGFNRSVTVWDAKADFRVMNLPIPADNTQGIAFSQDGTQVVAVCTFSMGRKGAKAVVWDLATRREVRSWTVSEEYWHGGIVFFSTDGRVLYTGGQLDGLFAWDLSAAGK